MAVVVVGPTIEDAQRTIRYLGFKAVAVSPRSAKRVWGVAVDAFVFTPAALDEASSGIPIYADLTRILRASAMKNLVVQ